MPGSPRKAAHRVSGECEVSISCTNGRTTIDKNQACCDFFKSRFERRFEKLWNRRRRSWSAVRMASLDQPSCSKTRHSPCLASGERFWDRLGRADPVAILENEIQRFSHVVGHFHEFQISVPDQTVALQGALHPPHDAAPIIASEKNDRKP